MSLGDRIAEKRNKKKITQESLGEKVGVTGAFLSLIERGARKPSYKLLNKIAMELEVPLSYLVGGEIQGFDDDPIGGLIASSIRFLDSEQKNKLLDYLYYLTGSKKYINVPLFDTPNEYAQDLLKYLKIEQLPVDPFNIAEALGVQILFSEEEMEYEGILYKGSDNPIIVLNRQPECHERNNFTIAMLIGHLIIPWHLRSKFYREKGKRSQSIEDQLSIEAREFAGDLLVPKKALEQDFKDAAPSIEGLEELAKSKYNVSLTVIGQRYAKVFCRRVIYLTIDKLKMTRIYNDGFPYLLVSEPKPGSFAYSFLENPPNEKEIRKDFVDVNIWFEKAPKNIKLYEESMLDPKYGVTVTLLRIVD